MTIPGLEAPEQRHELGLVGTHGVGLDREGEAHHHVHAHTERPRERRKRGDRHTDVAAFDAVHGRGLDPHPLRKPLLREPRIFPQRTHPGPESDEEAGILASGHRRCLPPQARSVYDVTDVDGIYMVPTEGVMVVRVVRHPLSEPSVVAAETHVITFAEAGFSMLDAHMRRDGCSVEEVRGLADAVNRRDEAGCACPRANVSAVPRRCIRGAVGSAQDEATLASFIDSILDANLASNGMRARRLLFDFRAPGVEPWMLVAAFRSLLRHDDGLIVEAFLVDDREGQ